MKKVAFPWEVSVLSNRLHTSAFKTSTLIDDSTDSFCRLAEPSLSLKLTAELSDSSEKLFAAEKSESKQPTIALSTVSSSEPGN